MTRWHATIFYRSDAGTIDVDHDFEEIEDLHDIVERGPDWNTIVQIIVTLARTTDEEMTIEEVARL